MDPQLDANALIRILRGDPEFVAFATATQASGLCYNQAAKAEFLANNMGCQSDLDALEKQFGIKLDAGIPDTELDQAATRLQAAFTGDTLARALHPPDARILATAFLQDDSVATGDLRLFKRAKDLGLAAVFIGSGRALRLATNYLPRLVAIPGGP
jgi:predicted nucleic acid-binding protein